jgi:hypothetical protein
MYVQQCLSLSAICESLKVNSGAFASSNGPGPDRGAELDNYCVRRCDGGSVVYAASPPRRRTSAPSLANTVAQTLTLSGCVGRKGSYHSLEKCSVTANGGTYIDRHDDGLRRYVAGCGWAGAVS